MQRLLFTAAAVFFTIAAPLSEQMGQNPETSLPHLIESAGILDHGQVRQNLETSLPRLIENAGIPGLAAAWIKDEQVAWAGGFGVRDVRTGFSVNGETVFEAASLSKPVIAYTAMKLVARGELDLDAPLWDEEGYERLEQDDRGREITARMVLSHTSGLPNWGGNPLEFTQAPGVGWSYSGEGFVYLATMLERRTGLPLNNLVQREVFDPLDMRRSSFVWKSSYEGSMAVPHDLIGRPGEKWRPERANAASSLHTTARDYGRFVVAVMQGEGLPPAVASEMLRAQTGVSGRGDRDAWAYLSWALGWGIQRGERGTAIWHWGDNGDFRCFVIAYPELGDGLVYFTNSNNGLSVAESVLALVFEDTQWALRFLDYGTWDQPERRAAIALRRAFLNDDTESAWALLDGLFGELSREVADNEITNLGWFLVQEGRVQLGLSVIDWAARSFSSASAYRALGEIHTEFGDYPSAIAAYEQATSLDPRMASEIEPLLAWLVEGVEAARSPVQLDVGEMEEYVGQYGSRSIVLDSGRLLYSFEGEDFMIPLIPLTRDLFRLETSQTFRIRFERDLEGRVVRIVGLYSDGRTDQSERSLLTRQ